MSKRRPVSTPGRLEADRSGLAALLSNWYWVVPCALFLVLRLYSGDPYFELSGDMCTFLELGRTFPKHHLFNHELYLIHPPPFGYAIGLFALLMPLPAAGLAASLLFAGINFYAVRTLGRFENLPRAAIFVGLTWLAISRPAVAYDYVVARVSILVCATTLAILAFLRLLREPCRKTVILAIAANAFALMVSDQALLLLPCELAIFWARGGRRAWKAIPLLAAASAAAALIWPVVRLIEFSRRTDLPAGISGTIEFTRSLPLWALIQPNFLPFTNAQRSLATQTSLSLANLKPLPFGDLPTDLLLLPRWISVALLVSLIAAALSRSAGRQRAILWLALSLLFLLPVGMGMYEWYGMAFTAPFSLLVMEGAAASFAWAAPHLRNPDKAFAIGLPAACAVAAALWLTAAPPGAHSYSYPRGGTHFLFARPPLTRTSEVARIFASMPPDVGIMAPTDISPEVVYTTGKRVVALPFDPGLLDRFIREYHISYLLTSNAFANRFESPLVDKYTSSLVTRFILEHPSTYRPIYSVREESPAFYPALDYYVFQVGPLALP